MFTHRLSFTRLFFPPQSQLELYAMALLSMVDMVSDVMMIFRYWSSGKLSYALGTLVCITLNLTVQSLLLILTWDKEKQSCANQLREQLFVWTLIRPGVDAFRVSTNAGESVRGGAEKSHLRVN